MDNITINNDTVCRECKELQEENKPVEIPIDPDMKPAGSVQGELIYTPPLITPDEQEIIDRRNFITKVKTIALDTMNKNIITNPRTFGQRDKNILVNLCQQVIDTHTVDEITTKFNDIICNNVLSEEKDFTNLPIYSNFTSKK